jgi:hypothetical protein
MDLRGPILKLIVRFCEYDKETSGYIKSGDL